MEVVPEIKESQLTAPAGPPQQIEKVITGNFAEDIKRIAERQGMAIVEGVAVPKEPVQQAAPDAVAQVAPVPEPVPATAEAPAQPQEQGLPEAAATPTPEAKVPQKFKTPDGQVDVEKVLKSYSEAERELKRLQNASKQLPPTAQMPQAQQAGVQPQAPVVPNPYPEGTLEYLIHNDLQTNRPEVVLAKLMNAAKESAKAELIGEVATIKETQEAQARRVELEKIAQTDPWVLSEEGFKTLMAIRQERPWINGAPQPWTEAYYFHKGRMQQGQGLQASTPTPQRVTAPAAPVTPANRAPQAPVPQFKSKAEIDNYLNTLTKEQRNEFWKRAGVPYVK